MSSSFGYLNKFGYGGHKFPVSACTKTCSQTPPGLRSVISNNMSSLRITYKQDDCQGSTALWEQVVLGEVGSFYEQYNDIQMLADMALYLRNQGAAADGRHNAIPHMFWWAWNENSGDTGGLVSSPNWDSVSFAGSHLIAVCMV